MSAFADPSVRSIIFENIETTRNFGSFFRFGKSYPFSSFFRAFQSGIWALRIALKSGPCPCT